MERPRPFSARFPGADHEIIAKNIIEFDSRRITVPGHFRSIRYDSRSRGNVLFVGHAKIKIVFMPRNNIRTYTYAVF